MPAGQPSRAAFTLVELLLAITVLLVLATLTVRLLNQTMQSDRIHTGARELQSFFAGARDRAIYAGSPVGVRLLAAPASPSTIRSFVYIGASTTFTDGQTVTVNTDKQTLLLNAPTANQWQVLAARGALTDGSALNLGGTVSGNTVVGGVTYSIARPPAWSANTTYGLGARVQPAPSNQLSYVCTATSSGTSGTSGATQPLWPTTLGGTVTDNQLTWTAVGSNWILTTTVTPQTYPYALQLAPSSLSGDQPRALPDGIVVDLNNSVLPSGWGSPGAYVNQLDVLFSPGGTVMGPVASAGRIHFVLSEFADAAGQAINANLAPQYRLDAPWQSATGYQVGNVIVPVPGTLNAFRCVTAGTSGGTIPAAFTTAQPNQTVSDGGATWQCFSKKPNLIVSLATDTGRVTTHPVDLSDSVPASSAPPNAVNPIDTFRYAEIGEVTQ